VSEYILNGTSAKSGSTMPLTLVQPGI